MSTEHMQLKLDDKTIEAKTQAYPEEIREPVQWLGAFTREKCNRQITILQDKCRQAKAAEVDYSTWHKIFTGKYFLRGTDGKVQGSVRNFLQIIDLLRSLDNNETRQGKIAFIETPTWQLISDFLDKIRKPERVNKFAAIVGYTGTQKSECFKEYRRRNNHGKVVHIESPAKPRMGRFTTDLAMAYGESASQSGNRKEAFISQAVNSTRCIIVDNVQRLYKPNMGGDQEIFDYLQKLQDDKGCTIILSFTPTFITTLTSGLASGYFEQFIGRMGGFKVNKHGQVQSSDGLLILPEFAPREDVLAIAEAFKLRDAEKHIAYLELISRAPGRIRAYFGCLQAASEEAKAEKAELTIAHLRLVRGEEEE